MPSGNIFATGGNATILQQFCKVLYASGLTVIADDCKPPRECKSIPKPGDPGTSAGM